MYPLSTSELLSKGGKQLLQWCSLIMLIWKAQRGSSQLGVTFESHRQLHTCVDGSTKHVAHVPACVS